MEVAAMDGVARGATGRTSHGYGGAAHGTTPRPHAAAREATVSASVAREAQLIVAEESEGWAERRRREMDDSDARRRREAEAGRREMEKIADWLEEELYDRLDGCAAGREMRSA